MIVLRDYQRDMIERARAELRGGCKRLLLQGPTGMGKTALSAHMLASAAVKGKRSWFVVHRKEILQQSIEAFVTAADLHVGIIAAGYPSDSSAPVQVCAVGSLRTRLAKVAAPDLVVWDECHHLPSKSWATLAQALPNATQIGLTATPSRLDGRGLRPFFDALVTGPSTADLIAAGYLSPYRLFAPAAFDVSALHKVAGDYDRKEVSAQLGASTVVGDAVLTYKRYCMEGGDASEAESTTAWGIRKFPGAIAGAAHPHNTPTGGRALVFAWSLDASRALAAAFTAQGIPAAHVDGETPAPERAEAMRRFRDGQTRVITNCELFSEGLDVPAVDSVFLLRPTASLGLYLQQCGRGLRPSPGKRAVRIFDHVGNYTRHGLPDDPRAWTLDGITKPARETLAPLKRCPSCFAVAGAAAKRCPYCQAVYPVQARKVVEVAGELQETELSALRARLPELQRDCRTLADWQALGKQLGYAHGWAWLAHQRSLTHRRGRIPEIAPTARTEAGEW